MKISLYILLIAFGFQSYAQTIPNEYINFYEELEMVSFEEKFEILNEAILYDPEDPWYYWMMATVFDQMGNDEKTLENYEKALSLDSNFSGCHASLARFLSNDSTKLELALEHINKAIQLEPEDDYYHIDRGQIYLALKRYDEALVEANYTLPLETFMHMTAVQFMMEVLYAQGKKDELKKFVKENDLSNEGEFLGTDFAIMLASVYEEMGERDKACKLYVGAAEPYIFMEEDVPANIAEKLKKCK